MQYIVLVSSLDKQYVSQIMVWLIELNFSMLEDDFMVLCLIFLLLNFSLKRVMCRGVIY